MEDDNRARNYIKEVLGEVDDWCELSSIVKLLVDDVKRLRQEKQELENLIHNAMV